VRFCSLQRLRSQGRVSPRHFRVWHSPLLRFLIASAVFASLWPLEFISPRNAHGLLLQSVLLQEIGCFFVSDFVGSRSSVHLLSLAATRSCSRVGCINRELITALQFDFRGLFPLTARSIGSRVSWLQWPMLSWFSILFRGFVSLCCALPIVIWMGVTPLLRRRLYGLRWFASSIAMPFGFRFGLCSPSLVGSTVRCLATLLLLHALRLLPFDRQPSHFVYRLSALTISSVRFFPASASCVSSLRPYRLSLIFALGCPFAGSDLV
jgi:hypothetical protein